MYHFSYYQHKHKRKRKKPYFDIQQVKIKCYFSDIHRIQHNKEITFLFLIIK